MILGIGTDIVEIERIRNMDLENLAKRILTKSEQQQLETRNLKPETFLAKRFAAKEAIAKALGTGIGAELSFRDIEITNDAHGKPEAKIKDKDIKIHLSISDERTHAIAFAVIEN